MKISVDGKDFLFKEGKLVTDRSSKQKDQTQAVMHPQPMKEQKPFKITNRSILSQTSLLAQIPKPSILKSPKACQS